MIPPENLANSETLILIAIAYVGSVSANFIRFMAAKTLPEERIPDFDNLYWITFFLVLPAMGIFLIICYLLEGTQITPFLAIHIGITAPITIGALAGISASPYMD